MRLSFPPFPNLHTDTIGWIAGLHTSLLSPLLELGNQTPVTAGNTENEFYSSTLKD